MAQPILPFSITNPGFLGLNIQDAPIGLNPAYALKATNCVIDHSGRIAARKGWSKVIPAINSDLGTNNITCMGDLVEDDGSRTVLAAGGGYLYKINGSTLTTLTYDTNNGANTAPVITANNWQFCQLSGHGIFWQRGHDPLVYDPAVSTTTFKRLSEKTGGSGVVNQCNTAISAYGRIWAADNTADKGTVVFSDLLAPHQWTGGTSGSLDVRKAWPLGGDEIVALASHNNFLIIFGKRQMLIYSGAEDPATMQVSSTDAINNIGCIARDSVQSTGEDVIFLSDTGVRSLMRTIQEKSSPLRELSRNVRDEIQYHIGIESLETIKSVYSPTNSFYLLTMPSSDETYCFDTRQVDKNGAARTTVWDGIPAASFCQLSTGELYTGRAGYIGEYNTYLDDTEDYTLSYLTPWLDFGSPIQTSILKNMVFTLFGISNQSITAKWSFDFNTSFNTSQKTITNPTESYEYGVAEYNISEYSGGFFVERLKVQGSKSGQVLQIGLDTDVSGSGISLQKIDVLTKNGRL